MISIIYVGMVLISISHDIMKIYNILGTCDDDADCNGYQKCKTYRNSGNGYCVGKPCKEGNF